MNRNDRLNAATWARSILRQEIVLLDTETTGLNDDDEIVDISIIDGQGNLLLDTLVKPTSKRIPLEAIHIHGIDNQMIADAPEWEAVAPDVIRAIGERSLVIYNAAYDLRLMRQSSRTPAMMKVFDDLPNSLPVYCAMLKYARFWGEWNDYRQNYRWQSLDNAIRQQGIQVEALAHRAYGDVIRTLALVTKMAAYAETEEVLK